jgi:hypothetical protein
MVMRNFTRPALLAGAAAVALAGLAGAAAAQNPTSHVVTIALPGGGVEEIQYSGNVAPRIDFLPASAASFAPMPSMFGPNSPFATLDRISAEMDRQAASLLAEARMLAREPSQFGEAAMQSLPPGSRSYSYVASFNGNNVCTQSMTVTSQGNGQPPKVVTHSSGDCSAAGGAAPGSIGLPTAPAPAYGPRMTEASAPGAQPYAGLVRPIPTNWQR